VLVAPSGKESSNGPSFFARRDTAESKMKEIRGNNNLIGLKGLVTGSE
jgi:hypothetical protein